MNRFTFNKEFVDASQYIIYVVRFSAYHFQFKNGDLCAANGYREQTKLGKKN